MSKRTLSGTSDSDNSSSEDDDDENSPKKLKIQEEESSSSSDDENFKPSYSAQSMKMMQNMGYQAGGGDLTEEDDDPATGNYSSKSMKMMKNMGYKSNQGLGKSGQGRLQPVEASQHKGRRGLGLKLDGLELAAIKWDPETEEIVLKETVKWLINDSDDLAELTRDDLDSWIKIGDKKLTIDDEDKFCNPEMLAEVLRSKSIFDNLGAEDMRRARTKCNPFETIRGNIFLNRAAVKMANMDAMFDGMFTNPIDENGDPIVKEDNLLYFADVCAGPGGFSEYILWRKKWHAKGFGFTLKAENDFKLQDFFAGHPETFDPFYGIHEDGNVFDPENIKSLENYVLKQTDDVGVHFMMSDGGFSVEGKENVQEILSKQLYLCQCLVALLIVREHGHFVTKVFDLFTPFSVGLIYLMYKCFQQISIVKPNTSRPANSERYLVCKWKKSNTDTIQHHLFDINQEMWRNKNSNIDTIELVPLEVLESDERFFNYIVESNNTIGQNQIVGLLKIAAYCKDNTLNETRQDYYRTESLKIWNLPDAMRKMNIRSGNDVLMHEMLGSWQKQKEFMNAPDKCLSGPVENNSLSDNFRDIYDWHFVALDTIENSVKNVRTFFMSRGGHNVHMYNPSSSSWQAIHQNTKIELSPDTLIYGEIVKELNGQGRSQTITHALHIIDGIVLGGKDIRQLSLTKRIKMCQKFAKALNKPQKMLSDKTGSSVEMSTPIRCKQLFPLSSLSRFFDRLVPYKLKDLTVRLGFILRNDTEPDRFFVPRGLLFMKETKENLLKMFSKTAQKFYYFDKKNGHSFFLDTIPDPQSIYASFKSTYVCRRLWKWETEAQVAEHLREGVIKETNLVYRTDFIDFVSNSHAHANN